MSKIYRDMTPGDGFILGDMRVTVVQKNGQRARLVIESAEPVQFFKAQKCHSNVTDKELPNGTHHDRGE